MNSFETFVDQLNKEYEALHTKKEDTFWESYMGLTNDADEASRRMVEEEVRLRDWLSDPERLSAVRDQLKASESTSDSEQRMANDSDWRIALKGWERTLASHVIESKTAKAQSAELVEKEALIARAREQMDLGYQVDGEPKQRCSSVRLSNMLQGESDSKLRKAAWEGLRSIESCVLQAGFLDIVRLRNQFAREMGAPDFYEWKVQTTEGMSKAEIFELLDALESKTRDSGQAAIRAMSAKLGGQEVQPWDALFSIGGDLTQQKDPFFPFSMSFRRWGQCFSNMGIRYRNATLVLDLLDRDGKYENGFMHGPVPAWRQRGEFRPARIHFTANAIPGQVGAGHRSMETFLHEGGHAAHFANIDMPSPCFSQEFAPTSVAFSEIQSIFMDNLIHDADWLTQYAQTESGETIPFSIIERGIRDEHPFAAWRYRAWLVVPYFEKAIYELPDDQLTPEIVIPIAREIEQRMTFIRQGSHRPVLSVPHLLSGESSAYYHGYVLAQMGVDQTRGWFLQSDGQITDNPSIGPKIADAYWRQGNRLPMNDYLSNLTGEPLSERAMVDRVNRDPDLVVQAARAQAERVSAQPSPKDSGVKLDAIVRVMDGNDILTSTESQSFEQASSEFEQRIREREAAT